MSHLRHLSFQALLKKKKCKRVKRKKQVLTTHLPNKVQIVVKLTPWLRIGKNCAWIVSLISGKSRRQINDWMLRKTKRARVKKADQHLTGLGGNLAQSIAVRQLHKWIALVPEGDILVFRCESAKPGKQLRIWKKWIERHHPTLLIDIEEDSKSFYIYKPRCVE